MESNRLIAEFMELPTEVFTKALLPKSGNVNYYFREFNSGSWYEEHELSYNVSWDWLVPVIEKIQDKHLENPNLDYDCIDEIRLAVPNMDEVYYLVLEFIKEYNKNIMNTTENNKLIAEFMGGYTPYERFGDSTEYYYRGHYVTLENMKFQTSWDWLMPVIQKVNEVSGYNDYNTDRLHIQRVLDDCINENAVGIDEVHKAVVEFIKEQTKTQDNDNTRTNKSATRNRR